MDATAIVNIDEWGFHGPILLAGFSGGICYVALQPVKPSPWMAMGSLLVASLTANYLSVLTGQYLGIYVTPAAFITGLCATWICKAIMKKAQAWSPTVNGKVGTDVHTTEQ